MTSGDGRAFDDMLIYNVVGARPNFMKIAPIIVELKRRGMDYKLVHTGQHHDAAMSQVFFDELQLPEPDLYLGVGSGSHAQQTARVLTAIEEDCMKRRPAMVVVAGDVNSTMAAALAASKLSIPVAHVESGLRSFDRGMPEELNRIVTDHLSDLLFTTEESGNCNLRREGIDEIKIKFVGNCMLDSLLRHKQEALRRRPWNDFGVCERAYALVTLHRPSNVDQEDRLRELMATVNQLASRLTVLFPVHPRTRARITAARIPTSAGVLLLEPLPYIAFLGLMARARVVLTDSGGIQEETTALNVPCLTLRSNTERPCTVECGTNQLIGDRLDRVPPLVDRILDGQGKIGTVPPLWDGHAAERVVDAIGAFFGARAWPHVGPKAQQETLPLTAVA
jgi:UDP-N-acetylglucosamine 2-epimerase (non-hydrolysing)